MKQSKSHAFCFASLKIAWMAIFRGSLKPSRRPGFLTLSGARDEQIKPVAQTLLYHTKNR
jgi:hypothetical protein